MKELFGKNGADDNPKSQKFKEIAYSIGTKPSILKLPSEALGSLEEAILKSSQDGLERSQIVKKISGELIVGEPSTIGQYAVLQQCRQDLFGVKKPLTVYHTHPSGKWQFSEEDITFILANPRLAHIHLVGSENGISAVVPTNPYRYVLDKLQVQRETMKSLKGNDYHDAATKAMNDGDYTDVTRVLQEQGLTYYVWQPEKN